ncbi:uncharacterized protein LOC102804711 [Saccoglossus kowalevskii]|uniref:Uncharacterized protein LOC102804711 n=1 Tax=Saccoglossus kowalevskii TaxID=10224 RepID=A0ABM0MIG0_SACKO|nr:PREDICTED: uncharacterized protein LOC102804711 [Saccoglossus kowalevskii]
MIHIVVKMVGIWFLLAAVLQVQASIVGRIPRNTNEYQVFTDSITNRDAYGECYKRGMMLAVPKDESAYNGIVNAIKAKGALDTKRFWFGIRTIDGDIKTIYGSNAYYRAFAPNQPSGDGDCIGLSVEHDYAYDDFSCGNRGMYVCEPLDLDFAAQLLKYKVFEIEKSREDSINECKKQGMVLARDYNANTHAAITIKIWSLVARTENFHIDALKSGTDIVSSDGTVQCFKPFAKGEVDGQGDCFYLRRTKDLQWGDQNCVMTFGYVCYDEYATLD